MAFQIDCSIGQRTVPHFTTNYPKPKHLASNMLEFENESTLKMISHFIKLLILKNIVKQNYKLQFTKMIEV